MRARNMALNFLANSGVAICPVRPQIQAAVPYQVALQPRELIQIAGFCPKMVECVQMYQNDFKNAAI